MSAYERIRKGFTLVELLVVISLIAILAAITITFLPNAASSAREARAATQLQAWLNIAKQRALRDQAPRGLRLWVNTNYFVNSVQLNPVVTDCQYTEQPEDFTGGLVRNGLPVPSPPPALGYDLFNTIEFNVDLVNGSSPVILPNNIDPNQKYWSVQPGDYIEVMGTGLMYLITQVGVPNQAGVVQPNFVKVRPPLPYSVTNPTANYRIVRSPRVVGDETLKLPDNTLIDLSTNNTYGGAIPAPPAYDTALGIAMYHDILFAPNGSVISKGISQPYIPLWVRAPIADAVGSESDPFRGDPTLVSVFVKTGFVGSYPPTPIPAGNPYSLVK